MRRARRRVTIEGLYYAHGLLCASYPTSMLTFVLVVVIVCSLPFFINPSGDLNSPKPWRSPWLNYRVPAGGGGGALGEGTEWIIDNSTQFSGRVPSWFLGLPVALAQQLYINVEINCSSQPVFCQKTHYSSSKTVATYMLTRIREKTRSCLPVLHPAAVRLTSELDSTHPPGVLSPLLDSVLSRWDSDQDILGYQTTKELLYGGFWHKEHTSSPSPSTKSHTFSLTFLLDASTSRFSSLTRCVKAIKEMWPMEETTPLDPRANFIKHFYFEPDWNLLEFVPLLSVYFIVFLYISFSVGKIDLVKSKIGLGVASIFTVVCSLTMSLGICTFFGLSISLSSKLSEVYPFFVIVLGLENNLIIVKAVMSTPEEFEVKQRIAAGLSREGWAISRNLSTLLLMLSMGTVFFNYTMKEFCIIGLVALLCDAFLQLFFFPTVLSIDLRRLEISDLSSDSVRVAMQQVSEGPPSATHSHGPCPQSLHISPPTRWRSKRVKFAYFLANARLVSRAIMVGIVVSMLVAWAAQTETFKKFLGFNFFLTPPSSSSSETLFPPLPTHMDLPTSPLATQDMQQAEEDKKMDELFSHEMLKRNDSMSNTFVTTDWEKLTHNMASLPSEGVEVFREGVDGWRVRCEGGEVCWHAMVTTHWPRLLEHYGYPTENRFLSVLPPITLTFAIGADPAHSKQRSSHKPDSLYATAIFLTSHPYFTKGSVVAISIAMVAVYWVWLIQSTQKRQERGSQSSQAAGRGHMKSTSLKGHTQDIECLCVWEGQIVSASLDGDIRVWNTDSMTRGCALVISRSELCGDLAEYANKWRPAAEGAEENTDTTSVLSLHLGKASLPSSPVPTSPPLSPPTPSSGGVSGLVTSTAVSYGNAAASKVGVAPSFARGRPGGVMTTANQNATLPPTHSVLTRSLSTQSTDGRGRHANTHPHVLPPLPPPPHPQVHGHRTLSPNGSSAPFPPPHFPLTPSPPPSPGLPLYQARRKLSTHSLGEQDLRLQLERRAMERKDSIPGVATGNPPPLVSSAASPLCGLPTHPPGLAPLINGNKQRPHSAKTMVCAAPAARTSNSNLKSALITSPVTHLATTTSATKPVLAPPHHSLSQPRPGPPVSTTSRRGHTRSKSSGPIPSLAPFTHPHLVATGGRRRTHSRNLSTGNISQGTLPPLKGFSKLSDSSVSLSSSFPFDSQPSQRSPPNPERGYDFTKHFNLFSPFTSNMALEYCTEESPEVKAHHAPAVWCMDVWNKSVAVGCGNGQIEVWNMATGSLMFAFSTNLAGATVISISSKGIVSGHMDGCLHWLGLDGQPRQYLQAHSKAVSVLRCGGERVVSGGYDSIVKVHRAADFFCEAAVSIHDGNITTLVLDKTAAACVSGCSGGVVCYWDVSSGKCIHVFEEVASSVLKLEISGRSIVGLLADESVQVWDKLSGESLYSISLEGVCQDLTVLGDRYIAACVESNIAVYELETGQKRFEIPVDGPERTVVLVRHILALGTSHIVCSTGRDVQILPCTVKQKVH